MKPGTILTTAALLSFLVVLSGCSGSGTQKISPAGATLNGPETAVVEIFDTWRQNSIAFAVSQQGEISTTEPSSENSQNYVTFKDLSDETWFLEVGEITYLATDKARINTYYYSASADQGGLRIIFFMIRDQGVWYFDDILIEEVPAAIAVGRGIRGIITDSHSGLPVAGAAVQAYNKSTGIAAGSAVTESNGFYSILNLEPGTYDLVIARDGYDSYTISGVVVY